MMRGFSDKGPAMRRWYDTDLEDWLEPSPLFESPELVSPTGSGSTTTVAKTRVGDIDGLLSSYAWGDGSGHALTITYSFAGPGSVFGSGYGAGSEPTRGFHAPSEAQQAAARAALDQWARLTNITFAEVAESSTEVGDIRFGCSSLPATAWAYYPTGTAKGGDIWLGPGFTDNASYAPGTYNFLTLLHEIGHALGLEHPHEPGLLNATLATSKDWLGNSVMSYRSYPGDDLSGYSARFYPTTPMGLDIAAIQKLYGADAEASSGNTIYQWNPGQRLFQSLYDTGGTDRIDWSNQSSAAKIYLQAGMWSHLGPAYTWNDGHAGSHPGTLFIAKGVVIENANGGSAGDQINGNQVANRLGGRGGGDTMSGMAGNDVLDGGNGNDVLWGGEGNDSILGGRDKDVAYGNAGADQLDGGTGNDFLDGGNGNDRVLGGAGRDTLDGDAGNDRLDGGADSDWLFGGSGNDLLVGGTGNDTFIGDAGTDTLLIDSVRAGFSLTRLVGGWRMVDINTGNGDLGTDILGTIERVQFTDQLLLLG
jgi:serralysin